MVHIRPATTSGCLEVIYILQMLAVILLTPHGRARGPGTGVQANYYHMSLSKAWNMHSFK